jgi:hypothetical protein
MLAFNEVAKLDRVMYDILDAMTDVSDLRTLPAVRWHLHSAVSLPASLCLESASARSSRLSSLPASALSLPASLGTVSLPASLCIALLHLVLQLESRTQVCLADCRSFFVTGPKLAITASCRLFWPFNRLFTLTFTLV